LTGSIDRLSEDLMLWSSAEFNMVEIDDGFCGTSSIMPQKKNPYALEYLKGLVATTTGFFVETAMVHKNPSDAPVLDWQRAMIDAWRGYDEVTNALPLLTGVLS